MITAGSLVSLKNGRKVTVKLVEGDRALCRMTSSVRWYDLDALVEVADPTNPLDVRIGDRVAITDRSDQRFEHRGDVIDVVRVTEGEAESIVIIRCDDCCLADGTTANHHYVDATAVEHVSTVPSEGDALDTNPVPSLSVLQAVHAISTAVGADLDPEEVAADLYSGCSFSVRGHGRIYRPTPDGRVAVYVDLSKPSDLF